MPHGQVGPGLDAEQRANPRLEPLPDLRLERGGNGAAQE